MWYAGLHGPRNLPSKGSWKASRYLGYWRHCLFPSFRYDSCSSLLLAHGLRGMSGTTPFDRERPDLEMRAIIAGDYAFKPDEYWCHVSPTARDFVRQCLTVDPEARMTVTEALEHPWMLRVRPSQHVSDSIAGPAPEEHATSLATKNLLPDIKAVRARQRCSYPFSTSFVDH